MKLNEARMRYPLLDGAIIAAQIAIVLAFFVRLLIGCGGSAFSTLNDPGDAGNVSDGKNVPDGADAADARDDLGNTADAVGDKPEATPFQDAGQEASLEDASSAETGPSCCANPTPACSAPLASCPIGSENHGSFPTSFEMYAYPMESCTTVTTPAACLCDYTCACIAANYNCATGTKSCTSDPVQGILITCTN